MQALQTESQKELQRLVSQIETIEEEKRGLAADVADKYKEAKSKGFDVKALRKVIAARRKSDEERQAEQDVLDAYMHGLGMAGTPLGDYADEQEPQRSRRQKAADAQADRVAESMT
jgi:uncharacterized protein (UPF0335 family)